ncbi:MAG: SCO6745 family protein, partial [Ktedonobacteraceae bacterium]
RRGLAAADGTGRALFAGLQARPWPDALTGQLWRACEMVREHRGDSHIAAYITAGFNPVQMNILTELYVGMPLGSYTASRGWSPDAIATNVARLQTAGLIEEETLTPAGLRVREEIEEHTDAMEQPLLDAIGDDLEPLLAQLNQWSDACIAAGAFPPNEQKRAAG